MDLKLEAVHTKIETYHQDVMRELSSHGDAHKAIYKEVGEIKKEVRFTNGKVKKIIIALVAIGFFVLGTGGENILSFIKFIV